MQITVTIDGKTTQVNAGATILKAAKTVGVTIPTLCADNKLHPYGACRVCLVEVEGNPRKFPACTTPVTDGMVIHTMSPAIVQARKDILGLLLINHPLDCPVCDKAGDCELQDLVHAYGLEQSKFSEEKQYEEPTYDSPVIDRNVNRCILCGKCVRICREQNAVGELAFTRRGGHSRVSAEFARPLDCEFCGECVEICPVGALTTRQFKYKARVWNLEKAQSVCNYCGCGCTMNYETREGRVVRVSPTKNNYLCSKGRFGWDAIHHPDRLTTPKMRVGDRLVDCTWDEALSVIATNLKVIRNKRGAGSIGGLGSVRTTNEDAYVFQKFMRSVVGTNNVDMLARLKIPKGLNGAFFSGELNRIGENDVILVLDKDTTEINPLTGIEIIRAVSRKGRRLIFVNTGYSKLNKLASVMLPLSVEDALGKLVSALSGAKAGKDEAVAAAADHLRAAERVAMIVPAQVSDAESSRIKDLAKLLNNVTYYPLVSRSNVQGALDMGVLSDYYPGYQKIHTDTTASFAGSWDAILPDTPGMTAIQMMNGIASGTVAALYIMGDDPVGSNSPSQAVLQRLDFLVVQDIFMTDTAKLADVVLPAASSAEKEGTVTNVERRLQRLSRAEQPVGESKPDWEIIQAVARKMGGSMNYGSVRDIMNEIRSVVPMYADLAIGACWPEEKSPLAGTDADLSLFSDSVKEVITAERLLFSSGVMITRSRELETIRHIKVEV